MDIRSVICVSPGRGGVEQMLVTQDADRTVSLLVGETRRTLADPSARGPRLVNGGLTGWLLGIFDLIDADLADRAVRILAVVGRAVMQTVSDMVLRDVVVPPGSRR